MTIGFPPGRKRQRFCDFRRRTADGPGCMFHRIRSAVVFCDMIGDTFPFKIGSDILVRHFEILLFSPVFFSAILVCFKFDFTIQRQAGRCKTINRPRFCPAAICSKTTGKRQKKSGAIENGVALFLRSLYFIQLFIHPALPESSFSLSLKCGEKQPVPPFFPSAVSDRSDGNLSIPS